MRKESSIAEISYVEFVNGMENKIPEPASDIPVNLTASAGNKSFTLNWDKCVNVTGYEVMITQGENSEVKKVKGCSISVTSFNDKELQNGTEYTVKVQSVNGASGRHGKRRRTRSGTTFTISSVLRRTTLK